jgi:hypothetical protein
MSTPEQPIGHDDRGRTASGTNAVPGGVGNQSDDFVTTSYDPDHAPVVGPPETRMNQATDTDDTRGYGPTGDAGFVDEGRADVGGTTGHRDTDYDTGRVDTRHGLAGHGVGAQAAGRAGQVRARAAQKAAQLRERAAETAPHVRAQAVEKAQQLRVQAAEKAPQMVQANRGKAAAALAFVLLVLWIRRRQSRQSSRTRRAAMAQQVRAQAVEKAQQVRAQAVERAHHLRSRRLRRRRPLRRHSSWRTRPSSWRKR